ncbi:uracil phosphoribosyltransferase [Haliscomenobacter sp.]|uniref:uracil phosphoribosyltransferase n=1 Tax=Haliscomenobacter sp. TaxID=2717303 RepID=UPI003364F8BE
MIFDLSKNPSVAHHFIAEMRNINVQNDRMRFRRNMERLGEILAYELSKHLPYNSIEVETPLGIAQSKELSRPIVLATILRAGLPLHQGMLNYFDGAENAFVSAYRKHHHDGTFEIKLEYLSCPNLDGKILILADPMLASGASMVIAAKQLLEHGTPSEIHFVTAIAATPGVEYVRRMYPKAGIWMGALDEELTAKSYIVPGLGDAGDLAYGEKVQF